MERPHAQLTADFIGVPAEHLRDAPLLGGLLIAAASSAGFSPIGVPIVRETNAGVSAVLLMDGAHIAVHAFAGQRTLLLDIVAPASHDFRKAVEVFSRRLSARDVKTDSRGRG